VAHADFDFRELGRLWNVSFVSGCEVSVEAQPGKAISTMRMRQKLFNMHFSPFVNAGYYYLMTGLIRCVDRRGNPNNFTDFV
jgi:hypothetical protein